MGTTFHKIVGPDMARILRAQPDTRPIVQPEPTALGLLLRYFQTLAPPDALDTLAVHAPPRAAQQRCHPPIAITPILLGKGNDVFGQCLFVVRPARDLALRRSMLPEHAAYPPFGRRQHPPHMIDAPTPSRGAQKFPRAASCRISLSSVRSETARRNRVSLPGAHPASPVSMRGRHSIHSGKLRSKRQLRGLKAWKTASC